MLLRLKNTYNQFFDWLDDYTPLVMSTLARVMFAGIFLVYFWTSARTKLSGLFTLDAGAYIQIFPRKFEALGYDVSQFSGFDTFIVYMGTYGEFVLPALIVLGLFTRIAALGMVIFVFVQTYVDVFAAKHSSLGSWFDNITEFDPALKSIGLLDVRTLWVFLLLYLFFRGPGPLSLDRLFLENERLYNPKSA